jgi:hypothetical protein
MKRTYDPTRFIAYFVKAGLIAAIAAVLLAPTTIRASGSEASLRVEEGWLMLKGASFDVLPPAPIPYLATMPWLARERTPAVFKIDTLLGPTFEYMRPDVAGDGALLATTSNVRDFSSNG